MATSCPSLSQVILGLGSPLASQRRVAGRSLATSTELGCSTSTGGEHSTEGTLSRKIKTRPEGKLINNYYEQSPFIK